MTREMAHAGWGDPSRRTGLPAEAASWLAGRVGPTRPSAPAPLESVTLSATRLTSDQLAALTATGAEVRTDDATRARDAAGRSYLDLLALRSGSFAAPDAVVLPTAEQVGAVLQACAAQGVAVVPFGGGTSVVGGVSPLQGDHGAVVALDLRRLDRLVALSETDRTATLEAGLRGPEAEALLNARGYTLGHFPQSYEHATIGGYAATRSAGQASTGYGRFDTLVVGLTLVTPWAAAPRAPPAPTCASSSSAPRAPSASSPPSPSRCARCLP
jgi:alkyldihydroxyacetonephosphate synthase